eukprot:3594286-Amphidinium_carterae.1
MEWCEFCLVGWHVHDWCKACVHDLERAYVRQATLANVLVEYKDAADVRRSRGSSSSYRIID